MAVSIIHGVKIVGVACAVPDNLVGGDENAKFYSEEEVRKISLNTGVRQRYLSRNGLCTSDLCFAAAKKLIAELNWDPDSIGGIIFLSQTPDYSLPATACCMQTRLGLNRDALAWDVNLGCSAHPYGIWMGASAMLNSDTKRMLIMVGDITGLANKMGEAERAGALLFGDAGSVTALELSEDAPPMHFVLGTDGKGARNLIQRGSGARLPIPGEPTGFHMNGSEIFIFAIKEVPTLVEATLKVAGWEKDKVDAFVFHQANRFILEHLEKKMKLPKGRNIIGIDNYGNTSGASIPMCLVTHMNERLNTGTERVMMIGFGVGYSWASLAVDLGPLKIVPLVFAEDRKDFAEVNGYKY